MKNYKSAIYSTGEAAQLCSISVKQLRHWEAKGYIPKATRILCGERSFRYFSDKDIRLIQKIKDFIDEGYTLKAAAEKAKN